jgi:hypothetical protein
MSNTEAITSTTPAAMTISAYFSFAIVTSPAFSSVNIPYIDILTQVLLNK